MDFLFSLLFDAPFWLTEERPKIEVRLLSCFPNSENRLNIEIENISNIQIELKSVSIVLKNKKIHSLTLQDLGLGKEQFILPSFFPHKVMLTIPSEEMTDKVMYFKFELKGKMKNRLKVSPINLFEMG